MGKRQRHTEFIGLSDETVKELARDPRTPRDLRRKAIQEAKFRKIRNARKRSK